MEPLAPVLTQALKITQQKVDLVEIDTQKIGGKFKKHSYFTTIGVPFFCNHPVNSTDLQSLSAYVPDLLDMTV